MLLRSLEVHDFRVVHHAKLEFVTGLNVLFGPNELGKSTLVDALRAAFLLPVTSKSAEELVPWGKDVVPQVIVEFETPDTLTRSASEGDPTLTRSVSEGEHSTRSEEEGLVERSPSLALRVSESEVQPATTRWRISKSFGLGTRAAATLERITTGGLLVTEETGRGVDGRLRELLSWGIPEPGGGNAPRGWPQSYLVTALLGEQENVTEIMMTDLAKDRTESGKSRLTEALGALAQEPVVTDLLNRLTVQVEKVFTKTGQIKKGSPPALLVDEIRQKEAEIQRLWDQVERSEIIESSIQRLTGTLADAEERCRVLSRQIELSEALLNARKQLSVATEQQRAEQQAASDLQKAEQHVATCQTQATEATNKLKQLDEQSQLANTRLAGATAKRDQLRETAEQAREAQRATLLAKRQTAERRIDQARAVLSAAESVKAQQIELDYATQLLTAARAAATRASQLTILANLEQERLRGEALHQAWLVARNEQDEWTKQVEQAQREQDESQAALTAARQSVQQANDLLEQAKNAARDRQMRRDALQVRRLQAQAAEDRAKDGLALVNRLSAEAQRLSEAKQSLTEVEARRQQFDDELTQQTESRDAFGQSAFRWQLATFGFAVGAAAALTLVFVRPDVRNPSAVSCGVLCVAAIVAAVKWLRSRRDFTKAAADREHLHEQRNDVITQYLMTQSGVAAARRERDSWLRQATDRFPDASSASDQARNALRSAQSELAAVDRELTELEVAAAAPPPITSQELAARQQQADRLTEQVQSNSERLETARRELFFAEAKTQSAAEEQTKHQLRSRSRETSVRTLTSSATESAQAFESPDIEQQIVALRAEIGWASDEPIPAPDSAREQEQSARDQQDALDNRVAVITQRLADRRQDFDALAQQLDQPAEQSLAAAEQMRQAADAELAKLDTASQADLDAADSECQQAQAEAARRSDQLALAKQASEQAGQSLSKARESRESALVILEKCRSAAGTVNLDAAQANVTQLEADWQREFPSLVVSTEQVTDWQRQLADATTQRDDFSKSLHETRGQLNLAGGAVIRDQWTAAREELDQLMTQSADLELDYKARRLLLETLQAANARHAAHLGRSLAKPVAERFVSLTGQRYSEIVLGPNLTLQTVVAGNAERTPDRMSVGARHQLATLLRLALAAHLHTTLVLDDQLAHSDPHRLLWFRDQLRTSVCDHAHQIIVITCRPLDYLDREELPEPNSASRVVAPDLLVADLMGAVSHR